jgi:hypothetical protein
MTDTTNVVREVACSVMADCAFLLTEPVESASNWPASELVRHAAIDFEGGALSLTTTSELAEAIACDMLGLESGDPEAIAQASSALGELVNVVAGALLARLFGTSGNYGLGLPRVALGHPPDRAGRTSVVALEDVEGRPIEIRLHTTTEARQ